EAMLALGTQQVAQATPLIAALLSIPTGDHCPPLGLSPAQQRRQTFAALLDQLEGLAREQPLLIICEDMHWADATTLELFDLAVELLVEDAGRYRLNSPLPPLAIPATLQDSLMARLDRLAPVKEVAQIGAAIGRDFSYALLKYVAGRNDLTLSAALGQLEEAELLVRRGTPPEASYSFKHALVQEAAYVSLLKSRRQLLHKHIGDVLRDKFPVIAETEPEVVAYHFTEAGLGAVALEWRRKAGQHALKRSAYSEAIAHLGKAVAIADELPDEPGRTMNRLHLQIAYGRALRGSLGHSAPETVTAWTRARQFAADINDPVELAPIHSGLFNACLTHGEIAPMRELADAIMSAANRRPESPMAAVVAHWTSGATCWFGGDYLNARVHLEQALATYGAEPNLESFRASTLDLPFVIMRFLALVLWPIG